MKIIDGINELTKENVKKINDAFLKGQLVIFPTETVYGIGALATDENACKKIYKAKNRAGNNPLIVHLSTKDDIKKYACITSEVEQKLIDAFMPGPFTLILKKKDNISSVASGTLDTIGIRVPQNKIAHQILEFNHLPVAAPSANLSGKPSGTVLDDIKEEFQGKVEYLIDGGCSDIGLESTVVKVEEGVPVILRPGFITKENIIKEVGACRVSNNIFKKNITNAESPGMMYKHYAPTSRCLLVYNENKALLKEIIASKIIKNTIIIGSDYLKDLECTKFINYGSTNEEISHNIFHALREADKYKPDLIIIEGVSKEGLGLAIMNRLIRASNFNYLENI